MTELDSYKIVNGLNKDAVYRNLWYDSCTYLKRLAFYLDDYLDLSFAVSRSCPYS